MPASPALQISAQDIDLAIFDLDGVITKTAAVHAAAWKTVFDDFLRARAGTAFRPFDIQHDYLTHVDGRPRYDGVTAFLASREIELPFGAPEDPPGAATVCGLANAKNGSFLRALGERGVETFDDTVGLIRRLRQAGIATAVVSASANCAAILERAGLAGLFDVRVDGTDITRYRLSGKPAPDTFVEAARRLAIDPHRTAVFEDALVGVEAGRAGGFALVIGVDRVGQGDAFLEHGAHVALASLEGIAVAGLPSALDQLDAIVQSAPRPLLCLDYDGTLTPIVDQPEQAVLADVMRDVLRGLAERHTLAVVSGRALDVIRELVGLDLIFLANHGFELALPGRPVEVHEPAREALPDIAAVEQAARRDLAALEGVLIERKLFSVAVHYRLVGDADLPRVNEVVDALLAAHPNLRLIEGKKVHEFRPDLAWDKGRAVMWLAERLGVPARAVVYLGDDETDEDVFRELRPSGTGIAVMDAPRPTLARYRLRDTDEVMRFLQGLRHRLPEAAA